MEMFHTHVSGDAILNADIVLRSGRLSEGPWVKQFEYELELFGLSNPVTVNSGTSALHLALELCNVRGREVILPAQTFCATAYAVLYAGGIPVFADIDPSTGNLDPLDVEIKITPKTKVILPVHWSGLPANLAALHQAADVREDIDIVEDAAHAFGATYGLSTIGDCYYSRFCCFSLQATKNFTCGDGGILCCNTYDPDDTANARRRRWFGIPRDQPPGPLGERDYTLYDVGYKMHMTDIDAAIGMGNLQDYQKRLQSRQDCARRYREAFDGVKGIKLLTAPQNKTHAYYVFSMKVERRDIFVRAMQERGVPCSVVNRRIDRHPIFGGLRNLPGTKEFDESQINLPCHGMLNVVEVDKVIEAVQKGW